MTSSNHIEHHLHAPLNTLFLLACLPSLGLGQVVINEFSCSNYTLGIGGGQ